MQVGLVGLPNAGKTTLFNALTKASAATAPFPFTTIEKNIGVVAMPDERLKQLAVLLKPPKITPATIKFVDIAGLVKGASHGEGLGNQFLGHIREVEVIAHVVRCFPQANVPLATNSLDAKEAIETVNYELILADLATLEKKILKTAKLVKTGSKEAAEQYRRLQKLNEHLQKGCPAASWPEINAVSSLNLLTAKPVIYVANISYETQTPEQQLLMNNVQDYAVQAGAGFVMLDSKLEAELSEIEDEQLLQELKESYQLTNSGLEQLVKAAYSCLDLITFYTVVGSECKAWAVKRGTTAVEAAAKIHSDIAAGFIKAEVANFTDLVKNQTLTKLKEAGLIHIEGRDYQLQDGDILTIKFH